MEIDLRYDVGEIERFINIFPWFRFGLYLLGSLIIQYWFYFIKKLRKEI